MKRLFLLLSILIATPALADYSVPAGATSQCFAVFVSDSSSAVGAGLTGLTFDEASLSCYYYRQNAGTGSTQITMATSTLGTYTSGAFKEIDAADSPGWMEFCPPNAALALAAGVNWVKFECKGAADMAPMNLVVSLISPNSFGYDGLLASESGTTLGLASGQIDADNQYADSHMVVFFDSAGQITASSCITASANSGDTVTTRVDISARIAVNDNYIIVPDAACSVSLSLGGDGSGSGGADEWLILLRRRRLV